VKLLLDQDVYYQTVRFLVDGGFDVLTASQANASRISDTDLLELAHHEERILITRDRDFGNLVFVERNKAGIIYLRIAPSNYEAVHEELRIVLTTHSEEELRQAFVVVEPGRHRLRRLS